VDTNSQVQESLEVLAYVGGPAYASEWSQRPTRDEPYVVGSALVNPAGQTSHHSFSSRAAGYNGGTTRQKLSPTPYTVEMLPNIRTLHSTSDITCSLRSIKSACTCASSVLGPARIRLPVIENQLQLQLLPA
jgi:hypothetical protein